MRANEPTSGSPISLGYGLEESRRDRLRRLIPRVGPIALGLAVLALLLVAWFAYSGGVWSPSYVGTAPHFWVEGDMRIWLLPDGKRIGINAPDGVVGMDLATGDELDGTVVGPIPGGAGSHDKTLLGQYRDGYPADVAALPDLGAPGAAYPDGHTVVYVNGAGTALHIRDIKFHRYVGAPIPVSPDLFTLGVTPDGRLIIAASRAAVWIFDAATGRTVAHVSAPLGKTNTMLASPDGRWILFDYWPQSSATREHVLIYDVRTLQQVASVEGRLPSDPPFSPDSRWLAINDSNDNNDIGIRIFDPATGKCICSIGSQSVSCAWMPDGSVLTIDWRGNLKRWTQQRPAVWWGVAVLPQFWLALTATIACAWRWMVEMRRWYRPGVVLHRQ